MSGHFHTLYYEEGGVCVCVWGGGGGGNGGGVTPYKCIQGFATGMGYVFTSLVINSRF